MAGDASWRPVHDFCEQQALPCLFPITALQVTEARGDFCLYLYLERGVIGEAEVAASWLAGLADAPVVENVGASPVAQIAAGAFEAVGRSCTGRTAS